MSIKEKRFQVRNSKLHYGKYIVVDIETDDIWRFYNLASARNWAREQNEEVEKKN